MEKPKAPHLTNKEGPVTGAIIACIGPEYTFTEEDNQRLEDLVEDLDAEYVDYFGDPEKQHGLNQKSAGKESYVISDISPRAKFSTEYLNCTGIIAVGVDKKTGENVSFLSHQDPGYFLASPPKYEEWKKRFREDLEGHLNEFKNRVKEETVDVVLLGGNLHEGELSVAGDREKTMADDYRDSIAVLSRHIRTILHKEPHVVIGPKTQQGGLAAVFDTTRRRLYMFRPDQREYSKDISFPARAVDTLMAKWKAKK